MEIIKAAIRIRLFLQYGKEENSSIETIESKEKKIAISKEKKTLVSSFDKILFQNIKTNPIINSYLKE